MPTKSEADMNEIVSRIDAAARSIVGSCGNAERHPEHPRTDKPGWKCWGTKANIWNDWPEKMAVVRVTPIVEASSVFNLGKASAAGKLTWTRQETMPEEARALLSERERRTGGMAYVSHTLAPVWGQVLISGPRNIVAIVHPIEGRDAFTVEMGCAHKMVEKKLGNCYYQHTCSVCGYSFNVDSSG